MWSFFRCIFKCVCLRVRVCALMHAYALASVGSCRGWKRISDPLEPGSQVWVLGTKSTESSLLPQHVIFDLCRARRLRLKLQSGQWGAAVITRLTTQVVWSFCHRSLLHREGFTLSQQDSSSLVRVFKSCYAALGWLSGSHLNSWCCDARQTILMTSHHVLGTRWKNIPDGACQLVRTLYWCCGEGVLRRSFLAMIGSQLSKANWGRFGISQWVTKDEVDFPWLWHCWKEVSPEPHLLVPWLMDTSSQEAYSPQALS